MEARARVYEAVRLPGSSTPSLGLEAAASIGAGSGSEAATRPVASSETVAARPAASPSSTSRPMRSKVASTHAGSTAGRRARRIFCAGVASGCS